MKKLFALLLAVAMVFALSAAAFAEDSGTLVAGTVRTASGKGQKAELAITYDGELPLSSVRFEIDSEIPFDPDNVDIVASHEFNAEKGKIVIWAPDGESIVEKEIVTITYVLDDWYDDGEYPVKVTFIDATSELEKITLGTVDGAVIIDNDYLLGDVTLDGEVNNADLVMMARYEVNLETFNGQQMLNGDIDQDGDIDNTDLVNLANYIVKMYQIVDKYAEE